MASPATEVTVRLHRLHPGQQRLDAACEASRYVTAVLGRRFGKTYFGIHRLFHEALSGGPRYQALWVAPTFDLTKIAWDEWHGLIPPRLFSSNQTDRTIHLLTGATLYFRSADNATSLLGRGYDRAIIDEASRVKVDALKRAILPTLADRNGRALAITTPAGKRNWVHEWYQRGLDPQQPSWAAVHGPSTDNPATSIRDWCQEMAPSEMGGGGGMPLDIYRQEILAEFLDDAAAVFRGVRAAVDGDLAAWEAARPTAIGIDVAKHQDFTVITGMVDDGEVRRVVAWDRFHRIAWPLQMERIAAIWHAAGEPVVTLDATGVGDKVFDDLCAAGVNVVPYKFTNESKQRLIQALSLDIEQGHVRYPEIPELLGELESYAYEILSTGAFRYNAPDGLHDDCVISLALANWGLRCVGTSDYQWI